MEKNPIHEAPAAHHLSRHWLLTGIPLSVSGAIGIIALFGQAVLNGVVMVSSFNQLRDEGLATFKAVVKGAGERLRTVLMTALLPMALSHGIGSETQRPLAVVIIGGLVSATLPTLYLLFERKKETVVSGQPPESTATTQRS